MAATVVDTSLKASAWSKQKPAEYKGKDLENALKGVEGIETNKIAMPKSFPTVPKLNISEIESCITKLEADIITLQKALAELRKAEGALNTVCSAASKTSTDLQKMAKEKNVSEDQKFKLNSAAQTAQVMGSNAATSLANIR